MAPELLLTLDAPGDLDEAHGHVRVFGWCAQGDTPRTPSFRVDGRDAPAALWSVKRPDVTEAHGLPEGAPFGFEGWVALGEGTGERLLEVRAPGPDGDVALERRVLAVAPVVALTLDRPPPALEVAADELTLVGWAFGLVDPVVAVRAHGAHGVTDLVHGFPRSDVEGRGASAPVTRSGFRGRVPLARGAGRTTELVVVAQDAAGRTAARPVVVRRPRAPDPAIRLESARLQHGHVEVEGLVAWRGATPARPVVRVLEAGGAQLLEAPADASRPEVEHDLPGLAASERCGFRFVVPEDAGRGLVVVAEDDAGRSARVAVPALAGGDRPHAVPAPRALADHVRAGWSVLDWGVGVAAQGVPVTVFAPRLPATPGLPHRSDAVDVVVVPTGASAARLAEATRVARHVVLSPAADAASYAVAWTGEARAAALPSVAVVIPVHGQDAATERCLRALLSDALHDLELEVVLVDDASPQPSTRGLLDGWAARDARVRVVGLEANLGFVGATNRGVHESRGEVVVLLNNDTEPRPGWLHAALATFGTDERIGVVGSRLVDAEGVLQDAGGVLFDDGSAWTLGRGRDVEDPTFALVRPVPYVSGAALAIRRRVWDAVGGLDPRFAPAYYEDVDLCFAARAAGWRVVTQPDSVVVHHEGTSHGTDVGQGIKASQLVNQGVFARKWAAEVAGLPPCPEPVRPTDLRAIAMIGRS